MQIPHIFCDLCYLLHMGVHLDDDTAISEPVLLLHITIWVAGLRLSLGIWTARQEHGVRWRGMEIVVTYYHNHNEVSQRHSYTHIDPLLPVPTLLTLSRSTRSHPFTIRKYAPHRKHIRSNHSSRSAHSSDSLQHHLITLPQFTSNRKIRTFFSLARD